MLLKRTLPILLIVLLAAVAMQYFGKKDKPFVKATELAAVVPLGADAYALKGVIVVSNPSTFSAKLGELDVKIKLNGNEVGELHEPIPNHVKSKETFRYPFEIRFADVDVPPTYTLTVRGKLSSGGLFSQFDMPIFVDTTFRTN